MVLPTRITVQVDKEENELSVNCAIYGKIVCHSLTFLHRSPPLLVSSCDLMIKGMEDHLKMTFSSMQNSSFSILRLFFFELKMLQEFFFVLS